MGNICSNKTDVNSNNEKDKPEKYKKVIVKKESKEGTLAREDCDCSICFTVMVEPARL